MGVLDRLTRRPDGARRFSLVAAAATTGPAAHELRGVALMPLALRSGAVAALSRVERAAAAVTEPLAALSPSAAPPAVHEPVPEPHPEPHQEPGPEHVPLPPGAGYAVLDVVTSGMSPEHDRLLEVAVVQLDAEGAVVGEWTSLLRPSVLPAGDDPAGGAPAAPATPATLATLATTAAVSVEELAAAPTLTDVADELVAALAGRVLVAHGVAADLAFLRAELARAGVVLPPVPTVCTLEASWRHLPGLTRRRLADCCEGAGVALDGVPTAQTDARAAAGLLQRYLARAGEVGERGERGERSDAHAALVTRAAAVTWPDVEAPPRSSAAARTGAQPSLSDAPGRLAHVLESLPLAGPELPLPAVAGHVELLAAALAAGPLDEGSARALALLADSANLTRAQVRAASRGVVVALAAAVGSDAGAGEAERAEVMTAARTLAVDVDDVLTAMTAAAVATGSLPLVDGATARSGWPDLSAPASLARPDIPAPRGADPQAPATLPPLDLTDADGRAAVRAWGREHGFAVSDRGRLPRSVVEAYRAARGQLATA